MVEFVRQVVSLLLLQDHALGKTVNTGGRGHYANLPRLSRWYRTVGGYDPAFQIERS